MILTGKPVAEKIYKEAKNNIKELKLGDIKPFMAVILAGEDPASLSYIKIKEKKASQLGFDFRLYHLTSFVQEKKLLDLVRDLNKNKYIAGIVVQLPLPESVDKLKILKSVDPKKDIDGFLGRYLPPSAQAILEILKFYKISLKNKKILLIGRGELVGKPLEKLLLKRDLKPEVCNLKTKNLKEKTLKADIIVTATGCPNLIKKDMVSNNTIIIDAGTAESRGKIAGDVSKEVYKKVKSYSPVPGGVGPVTVACLMRNLVKACKNM